MLRGGNEGVQTSLPDRTAVCLEELERKIRDEGVYKVVKEGAAREELAIVISPFDLIEGIATWDSRSIVHSRLIRQ